MQRRLCLAAFVALMLVLHARPGTWSASQGSFAQQIAALSETAGYFDTDNLISNESSYLQVIPELRQLGGAGGAYIGVGPDQNFTYIAAIRPTVAFIVDIRRDNLLLHLLFKALFQLSPTRVDYLAMLFGRAIPSDAGTWRSASIDSLVDYIDQTRPSAVDELRARVDSTIAGFGVPLSADDRRTIDRFHRRFIDAGLSLRFQSAGRAPHSYYPTYRELLRDTDASGKQSNVLASDEAFQFVRALEGRDQVIPVVGDLAGPTALAAIGRRLVERHEQLSAFYVSNVEYYLMRAGTFSRFAANLARIPHTGGAVIIRSIFNPYASTLRPSDDSVSRVQRVDDFNTAVAAGRIRAYPDIVGR